MRGRWRISVGVSVGIGAFAIVIVIVDYWHLAGVLAAFDDRYLIGARGQGGMCVLSTVADEGVVDIQMTVYGLGPSAVTNNFDNHIELNFNI